MNIVLKEEYWTTILNDLSQHGQITTEDVKFNEIAEYVWSVLENTLIKNDDIRVVEVWEDNLIISDIKQDILQRKNDILQALCNKSYVPLNLLEKALGKLVGEDEFALEYDKDNKQINLQMSILDAQKSQKLINRLIPKDITVNYSLLDLFNGFLEADFLETYSTPEIKIPLVFNTMVHSGLTIEQEHMSVLAQVSSGSCREGHDNIFVGLYNGCMYLSRGSQGMASSFAVPGNEWFVHKHYFNGTNGNCTIYAPDGRSVTASKEHKGCETYRLWANQWRGGKKWFKATVGDNLVFDLIPAIDLSGVPCMVNKVDGAVYYNNATSGSFVVGLTLKQAKRLRKLPEGGGKLAISLPSDWQLDDDVLEALSIAESKGWVISIKINDTEQSTSSASSVTYSLPRLWVRKIQNTNGLYIDNDGNRWDIDWCSDIIGADPVELGYERFRNQTQAISYWELNLYIDETSNETITE